MVSIRRDIIVETDFAGLLVYHRRGPDEGWIETPLRGDETLVIPEVAVSIPIAEIYENIAFSDNVISV